MKILIVCARYGPGGNAAAVRLGSFVEALSERHDVHVLTAEPGLDSPEPDVTRVASLAQSNRHRLWRRMLMDALFGGVAALRVARTRPDVVLVSSPVFLTALLTSLAARLTRRPFVLDIRDPYPEVLVAAGVLSEGSISERVLRRSADWMYRSASRVTTVTPGFASIIRGGETSSNIDVDVVANGFPAWIADSKAAKYERFTLAFHGNLGTMQDVKALVALAHEISADDIDILVVGTGSAQEDLRDAPENLIYLGELGFAETIDAVQGAHVGLSFRHDDVVSRYSFPVKVYEYIGLGIPVIIAPECDAGEYIERAKAGLYFRDLDVLAIAQGVRKLRSDKDWYESVRARTVAMRGAHTRERGAALILAVVESAASDSEVN